MTTERNNGYTIIQSACFDDGCGFAIGSNPKAEMPFVTWQFTVQENDKKMYFCGYYYNAQDYNYARLDYDKRMAKYKNENPGIALISSYSHVNAEV
ncbi:MAG: hypothetical protein LBU83_10325 [Bacteroidales bacterium]|jgi:hypothetical protein|nr:hypothetical protein [Bacteroidales bacterium]